MWAVLRPIPSPPNTISTNQLPPRRQVSAAVHNCQGREVGVLGMAAAAALGPNERKMKKSVPPPFTQEQESEDQREKQLRGADVLVALRKANAKKAMIKQKGQKGVSRAPSSNSKRGNQGITSLSSVKPLCVKPEWSERLVDFETRLEELIHD